MINGVGDDVNASAQNVPFSKSNESKNIPAPQWRRGASLQMKRFVLIGYSWS